MMLLPEKKHLSRIHCLGIAGAGMTGLAEILHARGYYVTGSDIAQNATTEKLIQLGVSIRFHQENHDWLNQADTIVYSSAIPEHHPDRRGAKKYGIPCFSRGQMLGMLMQDDIGIAVAGTHGKTSTVGLIGKLLQQHSLDPTIIIGGYLKDINSHAAFGRSEYFVTEADESDGSLLFLQPSIAVVTQVDRDHMGYYDHDFNRLIDTYRQFIESATDGVVLCQDDPILSKLIEQGFVRPVLSYGFKSSAMVRGVAARQFSTHLHLTVLRESLARPALQINIPLLHNAYNILAAIAVATFLEIPDDIIQAGLAQYRGVARRVDVLGEVVLPQGSVTLIDDYGHHPTEIAATIQMIRQAWPQRRLILVFQPHRYTRTRDLLTDFAKVLAEVPDELLLLPIYGAHEKPIVGIDHHSLAEAIIKKGGKPILVERFILNQTLLQCLKKDDIVLFQGAGDITHMAKDFKVAWIGSEEN